MVAPRKTRRELREERRQRRRRFGAVGIAAIVVLALIVAAAIGFGVHSATSHSGPPADRETTVLVSLQGADGAAIASMLAAHDTSSRQGLELLVPNRLITDVCGFGSQQFGQILALPRGEQLSTRTLSQVLGGVTIDGSWTLSTAGLTKLVDGVGGVTVDVDADVLRKSGGSTFVVVPAGKQQHLDGARAVAFASYIAPGEDATALLSRFQTVLQAVVEALPAKVAAAQQVVAASGAHATLAAQKLVQLLLDLAKDDRNDSLLPVDLPTKTIDSGGGATSFRVDDVEAAKLVHSRLAASLPAAGTLRRTRVLIENGVGRSGLVESACDRLLPAGYGFAGSGNAPNFNYATSQVIVFQGSVAAARTGAAIAKLLGLPDDDVVQSAQGQNVADVVVILGRDYKP